MKDSAYKISLDINELGSQLALKAKHIDTGRKIYISLRAGGTPYTIADDCYAVFSAKKPDGTVLYNACTIDSNEIIYEFTEQTCAAVGRSKCEIKLYGKDDALITSPCFSLLVEGTVYPEDIVESTNEFSALTELVSNTLEATVKANNATADAHVAIRDARDATQDAIDAAAYAKIAADDARSSAANAEWAEQMAVTATNSANQAAENATAAAASANKAAHAAKSLLLIGKAEGSEISLDDAIYHPLEGLRIFGKTTQDGTPTLDAPVDLVSVGDGGSVTVLVRTENPGLYLPLATPNGLPGIQVASGGNYTDVNGQMWYADEVDLERGVRIQRCYLETITMAYDETNNRYIGETSKNANPKISEGIGIFVLTDKLPYNENAGTIGALINGVRISYGNKKAVIAYYNGKEISTLDVLYPLETPIETPLSEEELAAYANLTTFPNNTTVTNDAGAYMELEYVMDTKKYIDSMVASTVLQATVE